MDHYDEQQTRCYYCRFLNKTLLSLLFDKRSLGRGGRVSGENVVW